MKRRTVLSTLGAWPLLRSQSLAQVPGGPTTVGIPTLVSGAIQITGSASLPDPRSSGIEHVVVVMMENRSFDHLLGWLPNSDGKQSGLSYVDKNGVQQTTYPLMPDFTGCGHPDPDHSFSGSRVAWDNGAMDGFLRAGKNDRYAAGYYSAADIPFMAALAQNYLTFSRYFASILSATFPNRMFQWAAQTDRLGDEIVFSTLPTIFDRLAAARVSHRYFFSNLPYLALWGLKYIFSAGLVSEFLSRAADGTLPAVSFIDPSYTVFDDGTGNDDHPHADIRNGDAFLSQIFQALASNRRSWQQTVLIINFDEWGGFFEHVAPPRAIAPNNVDTDLVNGQALLGFRVPAIVASPFTRGTGVSNMVCDHTSALKLIEWRWGLQPLTSRDASPQIGNPAAVMNFAQPDASIPSLPRPSTVFAPGCFQGGIFDPDSVSGERRLVSESTRLQSVRAGSSAVRDDSPWRALARTQVFAEWKRHPRFRAHLENALSSVDE